jgi:hypothetical protein
MKDVPSVSFSVFFILFTKLFLGNIFSTECI